MFCILNRIIGVIKIYFQSETQWLSFRFYRDTPNSTAVTQSPMHGKLGSDWGPCRNVLFKLLNWPFTHAADFLLCGCSSVREGRMNVLKRFLSLSTNLPVLGYFTLTLAVLMLCVMCHNRKFPKSFISCVSPSHLAFK